MGYRKIRWNWQFPKRLCMFLGVKVEKYYVKIAKEKIDSFRFLNPCCSCYGHTCTLSTHGSNTFLEHFRPDFFPKKAKKCDHLRGTYPVKKRRKHDERKLRNRKSKRSWRKGRKRRTQSLTHPHTHSLSLSLSLFLSISLAGSLSLSGSVSLVLFLSQILTHSLTHSCHMVSTLTHSCHMVSILPWHVVIRLLFVSTLSPIHQPTQSPFLPQVYTHYG